MNAQDKKWNRIKPLVIILGIGLLSVSTVLVVVIATQGNRAPVKQTTTSLFEELPALLTPPTEPNVKEDETVAAISNANTSWERGSLLGLPNDYLVTLSDSQAHSYLALVNRNFKLSSEFSPDDLSVVNVQSVHGQHLMRATAARAAEDLFQAADDEAGHTLIALSGYRSYATQTATHDHWISMLGEEEARRQSARPGHSEHQLGLALDITTHSLGGQLSQQFSSTPEGMWVNHHAHRFGFILRYPQNREADTGFIYEPWHIRYVGIEAATIIYHEGIILEEFLEY